METHIVWCIKILFRLFIYLSSFVEFSKLFRQDMPCKAENWHAVSHDQYFSTYHYLDICPWIFNIEVLLFWLSQTWPVSLRIRNRCFLVAMIVRRPTMEVATKRFLHQQLKIPGSYYHVTHGSVSIQLFLVVWIFPRSLDVLCYDR